MDVTGFVAYFSELDAAKTSDLLVLLDEPGLALHATAQGDLLRYMEERLAPEPFLSPAVNYGLYR